MRHRNSTIAYVIFALVAIGILFTVLTRPGTLIIPLLVFGIIFLLYKYPPSRWRSRSKSFSPPRFSSSKTKRRNATFRVINGSKDSSDEPPKYH
ncbi:MULTISPECIES: hypothetical protein [Paenibacillus]|uniref:hypothetical protein n=1 Tax=Paenibacillus TaxID=44249 RepID=UPI00088F5061|nr:MULTISPECIES: hypothetical protein [Paenibacillus]NTZ17516.1 hypothetical protein [Paenibacillus sp. JMULE4]GCL72055.1 hypothetical protein PN4B1_19600 [Paenibacillus naphthalenovorans]SDJ70644.1 hypothetical protein SAMN05421868_13922 [Paenibacillus naphthalenovorans]